jgi:hypothetical protein
MALRNAFALLAQKLQEAAAEGLSHNDLQKWLSDACNDSGCWLVDIIGDGESGDVVYCCNGDMKQAPYEIRQVNGKSTATIDTDNAIDVLPRTTYEPEADEDDHYASMESARLYTKGAVPFIERMISKAERDAADPGSFAGKGKSFPILKPGDVGAAVHAMGRAGPDNHSTATLKKNIISIAKKKGFKSALPKAWQGGEDPDADAAESARRTAPAEVTLVESAGFAPGFRFEEAASTASPMVKIISPGRGSSGFYTKEMLQRDGPKVFGRGTLMFINHPTAAEEAARPEGDWSGLAAVTTGNAYWDEAGKGGAALYAPAQIFTKHAAEIAEKAAHTGVSIRASGTRDDKAIAPDGKPGIITSLTRAESIDLVTQAGRDGKLLLESAAPQGDEMDATELKKLQEANRNIAKRLARTEAREAANATLGTIRLPESSKVAIVERALVSVPITETGDFDAAAFKTVIEAEIKYAASFLPEGARVVGMGEAAPAPELVAAREKATNKELKRSLNESASRMGITTKAGRRIFREGRAGFDPTFNSRYPVDAASAGEELRD